MKKHRVAVVVGTRPEAVKMAPVIRALARSRELVPVTISTSQHRDMVRQVLGCFGIRRFTDLHIMRQGQTLSGLSSRLAAGLGRCFAARALDAVLVQGDTSSALFGGLCAFYRQIRVGHVEAGLRTGDRYSPFPEEMNRRLLSPLATWHFAPTAEAAKRLRCEGVPAAAIHLTGNTVVDALRWMAPRCNSVALKQLVGAKAMGQRLILVTCHRRESFGLPIRRVARAIEKIARTHPEVVILFSVHPNPEVRSAVEPCLGSIANVVLSPPLDYDRFLTCLQHAYFVLSDSGGVQEEATALGKPVLVLRDQTERQEGVQAGALKLVGTDAARIVRESERLLRDPDVHRQMGRASNVFGDGKSAERIVGILERCLRREPKAALRRPPLVC
jgi:UDP-N-acetylglucosamine 2-epimerase (non-hydrolysing)